MKSRFTSQEVIDAYRETGSVWAAGKRLGITGQTVWERLTAIGYPLAARKWTNEEDGELQTLVGTCTIGEISRRLGRPYAGVALRLSRLGLTGGPQRRVKRIPRGAGFDKVTVLKHVKALEAFSGRYTQFCRANSLDPEILAQAIQRTAPEWWLAYVAAHSDLPEKQCEYCDTTFIPSTGKQRFCSRRCQSDFRRDRDYFGGNRKQTIGLAEGTCQMCARQGVKGLSAHHLIGKGNDPDNELLIALCPGCHRILGHLAGRTFVDTEEGWQNLINLVLWRRWGDRLVASGGGLEVYVDIDELTVKDVEAMQEEEGDNTLELEFSA